MSEHDPVLDGDPKIDNGGSDDDAAIAAEVDELTKPEADKDRDKVKAALIAAKKELRDANRRVKALEPEAARAKELDGQLQKALPVIDAVVNNPKLRAEALRIAQGTRTSDGRTDQPTADEDPDAADVAEELGFFQADGTTPDIARARRVLNRIDQRTARNTERMVQPLARNVLGSHAESNVARALQMTDNDGAPLASRESILETVKMLGGANSPMLANPAVVDLLINNAIGLDRRMGRTPKAPDEPLFLERQGGGRRSQPTLDASERAFIQRAGLTEKEYLESSKRLEQGAANRRGIVLGS